MRSFIYATYPKSLSEPLDFLFCLAPSWVFQAIIVTVDAVSSYPTFSPLPYPVKNVLRRFIFCDTIRHILSPKYAPTFIGNSALWCPDFPLTKASERPQIKIDNLRKNKNYYWIALPSLSIMADQEMNIQAILNLIIYSLKFIL